VNGGRGGISSGLGICMGAGFVFLRFLLLAFGLPVLLVLGNCGVASGGVLGTGHGNAAGGEREGMEEGGEIDVISTEGERGRWTDEWELGDGESSGAGGGGNTNWKVREAIWICDLIRRKRHEQHLIVKKELTAYRSLNDTLLPPGDQIPSTQAPFLPMTTRTKRSSSSSYSILAWRRDTLFNGPRSTSTCVTSEEDPVVAGMQRRPMVTDKVWR
jgi:hypothetical protein